MSLSAHTITMLSLSVTLLPFYIYSLFKWYQFHNHFLIKNRFPKEACVLIGSCYLVMKLNTIRVLLIDTQIISSPQNIFIASPVMSLAFFIVTFIFYRAHLVYLKCMQNMCNLKQLETPIMKTQSDTHIPKTYKPQNQPSSRCLLSYTIICAFFVFLMMIIFPPWSKNGSIMVIIFILLTTISILMGLVIMIIIIIHKVKDNLGILIDIWICVIIMLINSFVNGMDIPYSAQMLISFFSFSTLSLCTLWFPLVLLYKYEGTLNYDQIELKKYEYQRYKKPDHKRKTNKEEIELSVNSNGSDTSVPLVVFLENEENYKIFGRYLTLCFANENLIFTAHAIIYYHLVNKYKLMLNLSDLKTDIHECELVMYGLKFDYLDNIYKQYHSIKIKDNVCFEDIKHDLWKLGNKIYSQFIGKNAETLINIPYDISCQLSDLLETENQNQFGNINDYLYVFHDAMIQTWQLMESCYGFNFKEYVNI